MRGKVLLVVLCLVCFVAGVLSAQSVNQAPDSQATVFGTVKAVMRTAPDAVPVERPIQGVKVAFETKDGKTVTVTTNENGEYKAALPPEIEYTVTVLGEPERFFHPLHRPGFVPKANEQVRFDFTIVQVVIVETPYGRDGKKIPYPYHYQEHRVSVEGNGQKEMIIACGKSTELSNNSTMYEPLRSLARHGQDRLRVTVMFDRYTVRADEVVAADEVTFGGTNVLNAEGDITIEDGSTNLPRTESCVVFHLDDPKRGFRPCSKGTTTRH